jgi:hypothetical protein
MRIPFLLVLLFAFVSPLKAQAPAPNASPPPTITLSVLAPFEYRTLPDAKVWVLDPDLISREEKQQWFEQGDAARIAYTKERGEQFQTDENGQLALTANRDWFWVYAEYGEWEAFDSIHRGNRPGPDLTLYPKASLKVTIRQNDGSLAPNTWFCLFHKSNNSDSWHRDDRHLTGSTASLKVVNLGMYFAKFDEYAEILAVPRKLSMTLRHPLVLISEQFHLRILRLINPNSVRQNRRSWNPIHKAFRIGAVSTFQHLIALSPHFMRFT